MNAPDRRALVPNSIHSVVVLATSITHLSARTEQVTQTRASNGMLSRARGKTGERVSASGANGDHPGKPNRKEDQSIALIRQAIESGIDFMNNRMVIASESFG